MGFWQKFKAGAARFMEGRSGPDQLTRFTIWAGLILYLVSWISGWGVLSTVALLIYIWTIYRMMSKNRTRRFAENQKYLTITGKIRTESVQAVRRGKNMRQYKYFKCPQCKARLRLPRKVGTVTVKCGKCGNSFDAKA